MQFPCRFRLHAIMAVTLLMSAAVSHAAVDQLGSLTVLHNFGDGSIYFDGAAPGSGMSGDCGVTSAGGYFSEGILFTVDRYTNRFTNLLNFGGPYGVNPCGLALVPYTLDLLSVSARGGSANRGVVSKVGQRQGDPVVPLHNFGDGTVANDGLYPRSGLFFVGGIAYGATTKGGVNGFGVIYSITAQGNYAILHSFEASGHDSSILANGGDGFLYGVNSHGGPADSGTIYRFLPNGAYQNTHTFTGTDGAHPLSEVVLDVDGNLYGTTPDGGDPTASGGTVYRYTPSTGAFTVLHTFKGPDGLSPKGALICDSRGVLYGTTSRGGANGAGTVFEIRPDGTFATIDDFDFIDGAGPASSLQFVIAPRLLRGLASEGGTTYIAGKKPGDGTIFTIERFGGGTLTHYAVRPQLPYPGVAIPNVPFPVNIDGLDDSQLYTSNSDGTPVINTTDPAVLTETLQPPGGTLYLVTPGPRYIRATDRAKTSDTGVSAVIPVCGPAVKFGVTIAPSTTSTVSNFVVVKALDKYGFLAAQYTGTVHFTSTDHGATLPADATLVNGVGLLNFTFDTPGSQSITAADTTQSSIQGTSNLCSVSGPAYLLLRAPSQISSGVPFNVGISAIDQYGHIASTFNGTVKVYSNATVSTMPLTISLTKGTATVSVRIVGKSTYKISAGDVGNAALHGTSGTITAGP